MESEWRDVPRWQRDACWLLLGLVLLGTGILATCRESGAAIVIAGWAVVGAALVRVLFRVHRPGDGKFL